MPKVSICIPAYENPEGAARLLRSCLTQQYKDYEIILSDDSKTDNVKEAVKSLLGAFGMSIEENEGGFTAGSGDAADCREAAGSAEAAPTFTYLRNVPAKGAVPNWNAAISHAKGEFIKLMHHDDWFTDEKSLGRFVQMLEEDEEADLAFCGSMQVPVKRVTGGEAVGAAGSAGDGTGASSAASGTEDEAAGTGVVLGTPKPRHILDEEEALLRSDWRKLYLGNKVGAPSAVIVRRRVLDEYQLTYDEKLTWLVDSDYYMAVLQKNPHYAYTKEPLVSIGLSEGQLTNRVGDDKKILDFEYAYVSKKFGLEKLYKEKMSEFRQQKFRRYTDTADHLYRKYMGKLENKLGKLTDLLVIAGLVIELMLVIVDKSVISNPYVGQIVRITFLMFAAKMVTSVYSVTERWLIALAIPISMISWVCSGRNHLLRFTIFTAAVAAMGVNKIRKMMKLSLWFTAAGCVALMVLALAGVSGTLSMTQDFGHGMETRWCLGMGHPNAMHCMAAMLIIFGLYIYNEKLPKYGYVILTAADAVLYYLTKSNTAFAVSILAIWLFALLRYNNKLRNSVLTYRLGEAGIMLGILYSASAAVISHKRFPILRQIDHVLTGRFSSLWDTTFFDGTLGTWHMFSCRFNSIFFDLGWIRLVYWYGVIPAILVILLVFALFKEIKKRKDAQAFVMLFILCLYTVPEAHLVSEYIGRNYLLLLGALYLAQAAHRD